jgi:hypothetical protein
MIHRSTFRRFFLTLGMALSAVFAAVDARAEAISYSLTFCENLDVLKDPTNQLLIKNVSATTQHSLMMQRTTPYFELRNTSDEALISQISMSIGDLAKNFDWGKMIEASPGVNVNILSVDSVMGGTTSDQLTISFTGLAPGDFVRFRFGISADNPNAGYIQDYRETLFDLNGGNDLTGNSLVKVDFQSTLGAKTLTNQLPNFSMNGQTTATNMMFPGGPCFDHVMPFNFTADGTIDLPEPPQVPEPGSVVLLASGLAGLVAIRLRRRRHA